ncbi:hypothetical protein [Flagellimonas amoyensis]|uniref:hypothetical protein n=1 Tax=Flagellimonas amoyensis TaxID=2169401 RepID=UPI000D34B97D|nr:hypothetical protein [Allomuricauda amoyensis]
MKSKKILIIVFGLLLCLGCGQSGKKERDDTSEGEVETTTQEVPKGNKFDLEQKGDYTRLYAFSTECKITPEEVAAIYGIPTCNLKEVSNGPSGEKGYGCSYIITLNDGTESVFGQTLFERSLADVQSEISNWQNGTYEQKFLRTSNSGDHYIWKHPNQGYFLLYNPNYANGIKIQYKTLRNTKEQREYLEQKGIQAIDYLIEKYKS